MMGRGMPSKLQGEIFPASPRARENKTCLQKPTSSSWLSALIVAMIERKIIGKVWTRLRQALNCGGEGVLRYFDGFHFYLRTLGQTGAGRQNDHSVFYNAGYIHNSTLVLNRSKSKVPRFPAFVVFPGLFSPLAQREATSECPRPHWSGVLSICPIGRRRYGCAAFPI